MSEYYEPAWITYMHTVLFVVFILISIPVFHLLYFALSTYCTCESCLKSKLVKQFEDHHTASATGSETETSAAHATRKRVHLHSAPKGFPIALRVTLVISVLVSYLFVLLQTVFVPYTLNIGGIHLSLWQCRYLGFVLVWVYVTSRMMVDIFFILRAYFSFKSRKKTTGMEYNVRVIVFVIAIAIFLSLCCTAIPLMILMQTELKPSIAYNSIEGERCFRIPKDENSNGPFYISLFYIFGTLTDLAMQFTSLYLLLSKLFKHILRSRNINLNDETDPKFLMLATRLSILFLIVVCTSQISLILYMLMPSLNSVIYCIDNMINVYCLWLSFRMNDNIYYRYFCGQRLSKLCYPIISSIAVCCYEERNCYCCCCCVCCTCDAKKKEDHKALYIKGTAEIEHVLRCLDQENVNNA